MALNVPVKFEVIGFILVSGKRERMDFMEAKQLTSSTVCVLKYQPYVFFRSGFLPYVSAFLEDPISSFPLIQKEQKMSLVHLFS